MRRRRGGRAALNADINVTSLVDVAFVLLIIFMITAPMMQGGVEVRLPAADARPLESHQGLFVTVDRRGRVFVDEAAFSYADFRDGFRALVARKHPSGIYLRADRGVPYGDVVRVLAVIRTSGVQNVGLVTEQEDHP
jgi:biopolymer transport protein ExbD/biopolymer transport protein TolR